MSKNSVGEEESGSNNHDRNLLASNPPGHMMMACNANGCWWAPITTRLLQEGGSSAWNVVDGILGEDACRQLWQELQEARLLEKLLPARTKGEARTDKILQLLQQTQGTTAPTSVGILGDVFASSTPTPTPTTTKMIRGDASLFLSREVRSRQDFPTRSPQLHRLIDMVQTTIVQELSKSNSTTNSIIDLDPALTSVQLAVYPGDGKSGYVRHCDRGQDGCIEEKKDALSSTKSHSRRRRRRPERIITAIYYLTDEDWNAQLDGGNLRVFHPHDDTNKNATDICPYRDRLVVFRSDGVEHQVLPSLRRPRTAITMWFYGVLKEANGSKKAIDDFEQEQEHTTISEEPKHNEPVSPTTATGPPPLPLPLPITTSMDEGTANRPLPCIFVAIASYRDSESGPTLQALFETARHPTRISVGLVLQLEENDPQDARIASDIQALPFYASQNVRCLTMNARDATGPCYARALCQSLAHHRAPHQVNYILQIDSHMRFRQNWDVYLINLLEQTIQQHANPKVVLSTYPVGYTLPNQIPNETRGTLLVPWKFDDTGLLRQRGRLMKKQQQQHSKDADQNMSDEAIPCHLIAGGFYFAPSAVLQDVPYDPSLHQLFFGEELSMAVRLFTHGYDVYAPPDTVVYHLWSRSHRPTQKPLTDAARQQRERSLQVVQEQLLGKCSNPRFGLGTARTAAKFGQVMGVDFETQAFIREDAENGMLLLNDFVDASALFPEDSVEARVATLDDKTKNLIAFFLNGVN